MGAEETFLRTYSELLQYEYISDHSAIRSTFFGVNSPVSILVILNCDTSLPLRRLISNERMPQQLIRVRSLMIILYQYCFDKRFKLLRPKIGNFETVDLGIRKVLTCASYSQLKSCALQEMVKLKL